MEEDRTERYEIGSDGGNSEPSSHEDRKKQKRKSKGHVLARKMKVLAKKRKAKEARDKRASKLDEMRIANMPEEERQRLEEEQRRSEEEVKRQTEERVKESEIQRVKEEEEQKKAEQETQRQTDAEDARKSEEEARLQAEAAEVARKIEEEAKRQAEAAEAARKSEEEAKRQAEDAEAVRRSEEEVNRQAESAEDARKSEEEANRQVAAAEVAGKSEEEANRQAESDEAARKSEEEANRQAEAEKIEREAEAEARRQQDEEGSGKKEERKKIPLFKASNLLKVKEVFTGINFKKIDPSKIKKNYIWILLGILIVTFVLARTAGKIKQVFFGAKEEEKKMVEFLETVPVKVYKSKKMDFKDTLPAMGRIEGFKEIELRFDAKGILESFNFEEGERILEGDIIASLNQQDALLKLKYAGLEYDKAKKLYEIGGVDKVALDQKKLEYDSAKRDLEKTNIYAASDGFLGSKEKDTGTYITSQDKVGLFVDFSGVFAAFDVIEEDSPKIELGQTAEVFLDAYPGSTYNGTVDMVSPVIEGRTRTQKIKVELKNKESDMKPGMFARAIINTYEKKDALVIPASAFKKKENKYFVYVVHLEEGEEDAAGTDDAFGGQDGIVEEREIEIEYLTHDVAEVGKGLKEGEMVIRELHQEYKDKDKVEITEVQETIF